MCALKVTIFLLACFIFANGFKIVPEGRIAHGWDAEKGAAPYIVSIQQYNPYYAHFCGGSIIDKHWVLTAGHCLKDKNISAITIHAGRYNVRTEEKSDQTRSIKYYKIHQLYTGGPTPYDIALIYVEKPFEWTPLVQPISLPEKNAIPKGMSVSFGWGLTESDGRNVKLPEVLQTAILPVVSLAECRQGFGTLVHETNVCTASTWKGMTVCSADSGGPLVQMNSENKNVIIGVVSWGRILCGKSFDHSVFVRVSAFTDWIQETQNNFKLHNIL